MNRSSSFLAISSVLAILLVASIAINNVDETALRKPFPASADSGDFGKVSVFDSLKEGNETVDMENSDESDDEEILFTEEEIAYFDENFGGLGETVKENVKEEEEGVQENKVENSVSKAEVKTDNTEAINAELLRKAGFSNFFLQKKPFEGTVFDEFDFTELSSLEVKFYEAKERIFGNEKEILEVFYFPAVETSLIGEIYNLIKEKFKAELGFTVNETNSFGMASFYVNFGAERMDISGKVFLVVKLPKGVYALSYPRGSVNLPGGDKYFQSVKNLLDELLQQ